MRATLAILLAAAVFCFGLGISQPLIRIDRLYLFTDEPSLLGIVAGLWQAGDIALALVILLFSIVFPALKLALLQVALFAAPAARMTGAGFFRALSNWSMLDVVLVALVVFAAKTSGLATAVTRPGLWFFAASALLTAAASAIEKRIGRGEGGSSPPAGGGDVGQ